MYGILSSAHVLKRPEDNVCEQYDPDKVFRRFKVLEFPMSFVGLSTKLTLDVEVNLTTSAYLKTFYDSRLMKFQEAQDKSPAHRAYEISEMDDHTIEIIFKPTNECISKAKQEKGFKNRFVFDLRLLQIDDLRCCENEFHSEIGRYYISGQFDYCNIHLNPKSINFGKVAVNSTVSTHFQIHNKSSIAAQIEFPKVYGYEMHPMKTIVSPNSSKRIKISMAPTSLQVSKKLKFNVRNSHNDYENQGQREEKPDENNNCIIYTLQVESELIYTKKPIIRFVESLHKLKDQEKKYTFMGKELSKHIIRKEKALNFLQVCKSSHAKKRITEKFCTGRDRCYSNIYLKSYNSGSNFCESVRETPTTYDIPDVLILPFSIDFGRVGLSTYAEQEVVLKNNTKYEMTIKLLEDNCCLYTKDQNKSISVTMDPHSEILINVYCFAFVEGSYRGHFEYIIEDLHLRRHPYKLHVDFPSLMIREKSLRFGMVTTECFITSVPVRIYNFFNVPVDFEWQDILLETPFNVIPCKGSIPQHSCMICDVVYTYKPSKTKTHEVEFVSKSKTSNIIPIELIVITRKLSIKFLQQVVTFKDIPLNIETIERVKLENTSREISLFHVVEPLIPGVKIEPMSGIIRPKMIITFSIIAKLSCIIEFAFEIFVKINNKENVVLTINGNVVEPKILIHPKNITMPRIPCHMVTYVPLSVQNLGTVKTLVEVVDTNDENMFEIYAANGIEKQKISKFWLESGQIKSIFVKVYDIFRREYEMCLPLRINGLLGPPNQNSSTTELQYYIGEYQEQYENNQKVKIKHINRDISYCRITGVITVPWIEFSVDNFEFDYELGSENIIDFTMKNVSKYNLPVAISTAKLAPNFTLDLVEVDSQSIINEINIKFELMREGIASFRLKFHPRGHGRFVSIPLLFLDKHMTIPYFNLTFIGRRLSPLMIPSTHCIIFPPCLVGTELRRKMFVQLEDWSEMDLFHCGTRDEKNVIVNFESIETIVSNETIKTILNVELIISSQVTYSKQLTLSFHHESGAYCEVEISFTFSYCPITLHALALVDEADNPYPYFPESKQCEFFRYMNTCNVFLEKWMFQQGFRRDMYPVIPDTFHAVSSALTSQPTGAGKTKGINISYLNFIRRIAGPLMKHVRKITAIGVDEIYKSVQEIHDTYKEIIILLRSRGADLWVLKSKFLLSYEQFALYIEFNSPSRNADKILYDYLLENPTEFNRLNKQSWLDFILQSYKVFVMDSCFFECVCTNNQNRDIVKIIIDWFNEQIKAQHTQLSMKNKEVKKITNITSDLSDGIAVASAILNFCPFLKDHFEILCEVGTDFRGAVVNNACLIIEAMNLLRLYFPLKSEDFLKPNFITMLFLSIHLYVTLPMFEPKDILKFTPPLLRSSTRLVAVSPSNQESLMFNFLLLNNSRNSFSVEKAVQANENGKKMFLSIKYNANFVSEEHTILLVHGYNKTRIFDTFVVFHLHGHIGSLSPVSKCRVMGPLYRPNKVDVLVSSPFPQTAPFEIRLTDVEPSVPVEFESTSKSRFYVRRLNLIDRAIVLTGCPKESGQDLVEHKIHLQIICLSAQMGNSWLWFRSEVGEFFVRVTSQPRWDIAIDTLQTTQVLALEPCSCGEECECYRTTLLMIPHKNELTVKALRYALAENASNDMLQIFDELIEYETGKIILGMLLAEAGTNMPDVTHILRYENRYRISSRGLNPRIDRVTLQQHTNAMLALPVTVPLVPMEEKPEKYTITLTSECCMDIRTYRIMLLDSVPETN